MTAHSPFRRLKRLRRISERQANWGQAAKVSRKINRLDYRNRKAKGAIRAG